MATERRKPIRIRFVLDRTGSMASWKSPVVAGVNGYLKKVKDDSLGSTAQISLVQFDSMGFDILRQGLASEIEPLREDEYEPRALTPLFDATASALNDNINPDDQNVAVIFTDGLENASTKYKNVEEVRALIEKRRSEGWIIIFLAANIDAWKTAQDMGIPPETTMNVHVQGKNQAPQPGIVRRMFGGGGGHVSPVVLALGAAATLGLAYALLKPGQAHAAPAFSDADRNAAMGVDGTTKTWQEAVKDDIDGFDEPFNSIFDLPEELHQAHADLPADFDPSLGSLDEDGNQHGGFDFDDDVTNPDDVPSSEEKADEDRTGDDSNDDSNTDNLSSGGNGSSSTRTDDDDDSARPATVVPDDNDSGAGIFESIADTVSGGDD